MPKLSRCAVLASLLLAAPAFAQADAPGDIDAGGDRVTVGVAAGTTPDYEGSNHNRWLPIPGVQGRIGGFGFTVVGNRASIDLVPTGDGPVWDFQAGPVAVVNFNRTSGKSIDDPRVRALGEVGTAIEIGGYVGIGKTGVVTSDYDKLSVSLGYRQDVGGVHESGVFTPSVSYTTPLSTKALVGLFASADIVQGEYARTYFGVSPAGSTASGLPAFTLGGGKKDITVGALFAYSLTGNLTHGLSLVGGGTYRRLDDDFAASPLVAIAGSRHQWTGALGLAYTF